MLHHSWKAVLAAMGSWHQGKLFIEHSVAIGHDALHILAGTLLWLVLALALRRPLTWWRPWLAVLALNIWNEAVDLTLEQWSDRGWQYGETAKDLVLTMAVPTVLMFAARLRPDLFRHDTGAAGSRRGVRTTRRG
jgi:hypothetical protein